MASALTNLTSLLDSVDRQVYTTASISPTANRLVLAAIANWPNVGSAASPTVTGNGLTWVQVAAIAIGTGYMLTLFRAMGSSPTSGIVSADFGATVQGRCHIIIDEISGVNTGGTNGSGAVVQSTSALVSSQTSATLTLGAFAAVINGTYGCFYANNSEGQTPGSGFTTGAITTVVTESMQSEWRADNDTSVDASWAAASNAVGIAAEIKAATGLLFRGS